MPDGLRSLALGRKAQREIVMHARRAVVQPQGIPEMANGLRVLSRPAVRLASHCGCARPPAQAERLHKNRRRVLVLPRAGRAAQVPLDRDGVRAQRVGAQVGFRRRLQIPADDSARARLVRLEKAGNSVVASPYAAIFSSTPSADTPRLYASIARSSASGRAQRRNQPARLRKSSPGKRAPIDFRSG